MIILLSLLASFVIYSSYVGIKDKKALNAVEEFKAKAEFYQYSWQYDTNFYIVRTDEMDITKSFTINHSGDFCAGSAGDIILSLNYDDFTGLPPIDFLLTFYAGGHASLSAGNMIIEAMGGNPKPEDNVVTLSLNTWLKDRENFVGLKVKTSLEIREAAVEKAKEKVGLKYNGFFLIHPSDEFYCTDIVTRAYQEVDSSIILDNDKVAVHSQDIVLSDFVYIFMYMEDNTIPEDEREGQAIGSHNLYFLEDGTDYIFE